MFNKFEKQLEKIRRQKKLLIALILFFVVILTWILISIFASQTGHVIGPELVKLAKPLVPSIDTKLLDDLQARSFFTEEELEEFSIYVLLSERGEDAGKVIDVTNQEVVAGGNEEDENEEEVEEVQEQAATEAEDDQAEITGDFEGSGMVVTDDIGTGSAVITDGI